MTHHTSWCAGLRSRRQCRDSAGGLSSAAEPPLPFPCPAVRRWVQPTPPDARAEAAAARMAMIEVDRCVEALVPEGAAALAAGPPPEQAGVMVYRLAVVSHPRPLHCLLLCSTSRAAALQYCAVGRPGGSGAAGCAGASRHAAGPSPPPPPHTPPPPPMAAHILLQPGRRARPPC